MLLQTGSISLLLHCVQVSLSVIVCPSFKDYFFYRTNANCFENPDGEAEKPSEIIKRHGFISKTFNITTEDGYIISVERLHKKIKKTAPIVIGPGIYMNSLAFINRGNKSLAFLLADNGYQVWIINWRGTRFSRNHNYLSASDKEYWNIGFHKMAVYDLKAVMKKIFEETKSKGIYFGFSMGTTIGMIFNIKEQKTAENTLKGMFHIAPITRLDYSKSILKYLNPFWPVVRLLLTKVGHGEILLYKKNSILCGSHPFQVLFCELIKIPMFGNSFKYLDPLTYPVTAIQNRDSISINTVEHYHQIIRTKSFRELDFGEKENMEKYNSDQPPLYDLSKLTLPQSMLVGGRDILATPKDTRYLYDQLPEKSKCGYALVEKYGHRDFINSKDVDSVLFERVLNTINRIDEGECDE